VPVDPKLLEHTLETDATKVLSIVIEVPPAPTVEIPEYVGKVELGIVYEIISLTLNPEANEEPS
jgi:hypothetical protein